MDNRRKTKNKMPALQRDEQKKKKRDNFCNSTEYMHKFPSDLRVFSLLKQPQMYEL